MMTEQQLEDKVNGENTLRAYLKKSSIFYDSFVNNVNEAHPLLKKVTPPNYTDHGYAHSLMIEFYINELLPEAIKTKLCESEKYILLNAIYCHDLGMICYNNFQSIIESDLTEKVKNELFTLNQMKKLHIEEFFSVDRERHNLNSYKMIWNEQTCNSQIISIPTQLNKFYGKYIAQLCLGHRNYKDEQGIKIDTLNNLEIIKEDGGDINVPFLASVLRFADEMDITANRANPLVFENIKNWIGENSIKEWKKHQYINKIEIITDNSRWDITIIPNKERFNEIDELQGIDSRDRDIRNVLFAMKDKIQDTLSNEVQKYFNNNPYLGFSTINVEKDDKIITSNDEQNYVDSKKKYTSAIQERAELSSLSVSDTISDDLINNEYNELALLKKIRSFIDTLNLKEELISIGNFLLPSGRKTHYYVNTHLLIPQNNFLKLITDYYATKYKEKKIDCVIGIDTAGRLIGPLLSLKLKSAYTYLTSVRKEETGNSISFEGKSLIDSTDSCTKIKNILVVTDVFSSGETISAANKVIKGKMGSIEFNIYFESIFSIDNNNLEKIKENDGVPVNIICNKFQYKTYTKDDMEKDGQLKEEFEILKTINK